MERGHALADTHAPSVRGFIFSQLHLPHVHWIVHALGIRLEHVQDQPPAGRKMLAHALQATHLLPHFQQVLEWPKRNDNQPEFFAEVEPRHVPLHKVNTFPRFYAERRPFFHRALQHAPGKIKPGNPLSCFRQRHGDSSCPATQL